MREAKYLDFPIAEYRRRYECLQDSMATDGFDALLLTSRDNVEYLTGFTTPSWRLTPNRCWLAVLAGRDPVLFLHPTHEANATATSWVEDVRLWGSGGRDNLDLVSDLFRAVGAGVGKVGMELGSGTVLKMSIREYEGLRQRLPEADFVDAEYALGRARWVKSPLEIERLARACAITEAGHRAGFSALAEGRTEREIITAIIQEWNRLGADDPANGTNPGYLSFQADRVTQMTPSPTDRRIQKGDLVQVDGGAVYRGYCADIYRNAYVGSALPARLQVYSQASRQVLKAVVKAIRPGITSAEMCAVASKAARDLGVASFRRNLTTNADPENIYLGHGLGFSIIELPHINPADRTPWVENMCGTVLVSFGDEETGYVEWEDNFVVIEDGAKVLTPSPKEIWLTG
jgi:Xaa-Pro dipeptidase